MSVTFSPEFVNNVEHKTTCLCGEWVGGVYPTFDDAHFAVKALNIKPECSDVYCADYVCVEQAVPAPEVQMSNMNASELLDILGIRVGEDFSDRCTGSLSAEDFLGRVLVAQGLNPEDAGVPSVTVGNMVDCGRPAGYTDAKLDAMREVAKYASERCLTVQWG